MSCVNYVEGSDPAFCFGTLTDQLTLFPWLLFPRSQNTVRLINGSAERWSQWSLSRFDLYQPEVVYRPGD